MSNFLDIPDDYDPTAVDTSRRGVIEPVPAGEYLVECIEAEDVRKDNGNAMLKLVWEIKTGPSERRKIFENLNYRHANPDAQRIALEALTELWRDALGQPGKPERSDQFIGATVVVKVSVEKRKDNGEPQNRIKKYLPMNAPPLAAGGPPPRQTAPAQAANSRQPPPRGSAAQGGRWS